MKHYIDKDALVAEIERRKDEITFLNEFANGTKFGLETAIDVINSLEVKEVEEEPVSEDLAKAAKENAKIERSDDTEVGYDINRFGGFVDGANWQKQQMMAKAIEGGCFSYKNGFLHVSCDVDEHITNIKFGDKVKVIVIKEE